MDKVMKQLAILAAILCACGCSVKRDYYLKEDLVIRYSAPGEPEMQAKVPRGSVATITTHNGAITSINIVP